MMSGSRNLWSHSFKQQQAFPRTHSEGKAMRSICTLAICILATARGAALRASSTIPTNNIVQLAQSVPDLSTLVTALKDGKLTETLSGTGPFTVFAPTNEAFAKIPKTTLAHLLDPKNIKELQSVLEYHVISGSVYSKDLKTYQTAKTLEGDEVKIVKAGRVLVNNATVTAADNKANNGVVHIIDSVLMPPVAPTPAPTPAKPTQNIVQLAQSVPDLSTLVSALVAGKLTTTLSQMGPFTVFAPTNEAFAKLPAATLAHLLDPVNIKELQKVLEFHVVQGAALFSKDLKSFESVKTVEGDKLTIYKSGGQVTVSDSGATSPRSGFKKVTSADNAASNGVVHIIDGVLTPPSGPAPAPADNHLWFRAPVPWNRTGGIEGYCGDVDAAPRMPASLFESQNAAALKRYINITIDLYHFSLSTYKTQLELGRCKDIGYTTYLGPSSKNIQWAPPALMKGICQAQCNCLFPSTCRDQPDDPAAGKWCSLCGPKYNEPIAIEQWEKRGTAVFGLK